MKKGIVYKIVYVLIIVLTQSSCITDDDYKIPETNIKGTNLNIPLSNITTFKAIRSRLEQAQKNGLNTVLINDDEDLYIEGYVISSDRSGNFFKELIIQNKVDDSDSDSDPRLGFKVEINVSSLSDTYDVGRKVYIKMEGLSVGESNGVVAIGKGDGNKIDQIQESEYKDIIIRGSQVVNLKPKVSSLPLSKNDINTLIQLNNMQINRFELGRTFAGESIDKFDGFRVMEHCSSGVSLILQTSTFSDFKSLTVPEGKGRITGILSRDFGDDFNVFSINSLSDINFDNSERCDPLELICKPPTTLANTNLFYEDFESQKNNKPIEGNGWTNHIESGRVFWEAYSSTSSNASLGRSARLKSSSSGDQSNIVWLITPAINLDAHKNVVLKFKTSNSLADSSFLEVLYSLNWDGNQATINTATWGELSEAYIVKDTDSFVPWFDSGIVNLSCATGIMHIAFKYTGNGQENFDGVYELDEISIDYKK